MPCFFLRSHALCITSSTSQLKGAYTTRASVVLHHACLMQWRVHIGHRDDAFATALLDLTFTRVYDRHSFQLLMLRPWTASPTQGRVGQDQDGGTDDINRCWTGGRRKRKQRQAQCCGGACATTIQEGPPVKKNLVVHLSDPYRDRCRCMMCAFEAALASEIAALANVSGSCMGSKHAFCWWIYIYIWAGSLLFLCEAMDLMDRLSPLAPSEHACEQAVPPLSCSQNLKLCTCNCVWMTGGGDEKGVTCVCTGISCLRTLAVSRQGTSHKWDGDTEHIKELYLHAFFSD